MAYFSDPTNYEMQVVENFGRIRDRLTLRLANPHASLDVSQFFLDKVCLGFFQVFIQLDPNLPTFDCQGPSVLKLLRLRLLCQTGQASNWLETTFGDSNLAPAKPTTLAGRHYCTSAFDLLKVKSHASLFVNFKCGKSLTLCTLQVTRLKPHIIEIAANIHEVKTWHR